MLYYNYTPELVYQNIETILDAVAKLNKVAGLKNINFNDIKNNIFGKLLRNNVPYTKSQIKKIFVTENEFNLEEYVKELPNISYIKVPDFPINLDGEEIDNFVEFQGQDFESDLDTALNNHLCKYQASYLMGILLSVANQYLTFKSNASYPLNKIFVYRQDFSNEEIEILTDAQWTVEKNRINMINTIAKLSVFTDYKRDIVKLITSTIFLKLDKELNEGIIKMSLENYIDHENSKMKYAKHEERFRAEILGKLK